MSEVKEQKDDGPKKKVEHVKFERDPALQKFDNDALELRISSSEAQIEDLLKRLSKVEEQKTP